MSVNKLLEYRIKKALKKKRVPTNKEREERARKSGGFDVSDIDKEALKHMQKTHEHCYWCQQDTLVPNADDTHREGTIKMECSSPGCPNNPDTTKVDIMPHMQRKYGRYIDGTLCHDFGKLLLARDPSRLWLTNKNIIL